MERQDPTPIYFRLEQEFRRRIEAGEWKLGDLFPAERELVERYGVSRMTLRQALSGLVADGLLRRERGKGTFVSGPKIHKELSSLLSFTEDMTRRGKRAGARLLDIHMEAMSPHVASGLGTDAGTPVVVVERLRLADDEPVGIEKSHLVFESCHQLLEEDLTGSLYGVLREHYRLVPIRAEERIEAGPCSRAASDRLGVRSGSPALLITRVTYASDNRPFEFVQSVYRGDRYVFHVDLAAGTGYVPQSQSLISGTTR